MEKWALKIGLIMKEAESDKALHWLTSAIGEDPALIGLTRVEGGGPAIGAAQQLGLGQVCPKSMADVRSQNPGRIGLKNRNSTTLCCTRPKVAPSEVVQNSTEPVKEGWYEGDRPAGRDQQNEHPRQELVDWLVGGDGAGQLGQSIKSGDGDESG